MSIIASGISYRHTNNQPLFEHVALSVPDGAKVSLIGPNGVGKTTLLQLLGGRLAPAAGSVATSSQPYYIPQHTTPDERSIAELLGVDDKLRALQAICAGATDTAWFDTLNDDWTIEERCRAVLAEWELRDAALDTPVAALSGGERTKVLLAGLSLHNPAIVLLDEPTNHLDRRARAKLYDYIGSTHATLVVVSHDITLLNLLHTTCELTAAGIRLYGGNYDFYREQKAIEEQALAERIGAVEGVEYVAVPPVEVIESMQSTVRHISLSLVIFLAVLLVISLLLLNNTIRLAIYAKRHIINTMKLVGATKWYIMRPLLHTALRQGICAGIGAGMAMCLAVYGLERFTPEGIRMRPREEVAAIIGIMTVAGILISVLFSAVAINKFVNMKSNKIHLY